MSHCLNFVLTQTCATWQIFWRGRDFLYTPVMAPTCCPVWSPTPCTHIHTLPIGQQGSCFWSLSSLGRASRGCVCPVVQVRFMAGFGEWAITTWGRNRNGKAVKWNVMQYHLLKMGVELWRYQRKAIHVCVCRSFLQCDLLCGLESWKDSLCTLNVCLVNDWYTPKCHAKVGNLVGNFIYFFSVVFLFAKVMLFFKNIFHSL